MKVFGRLGVSVLVVFLLGASVSNGQSPARGRYDLGVEHAVRGEFKEAKEAFERVLKDDSSYTPAKESLKIIEDIGDQIIRSNTAVYLFKGASHSNRGQWDEALPEFTKAIEINPTYPYAYANRGSIYYRKGQHDWAISDYTKALKINPRYADAYNNRGRVHMVSLGNNDKACSDWKRACELGLCWNYTIARRKGDCK